MLASWDNTSGEGHIHVIKPEFKEESGAVPVIMLVFSFTFTTEPAASVLFSGDRCEHAGTVYMK